jgi:hypothetical protein
MAEKRAKKGVMRNGVDPDVGKATQFKAGCPPGPGRPPTKILRVVARELAEELDPKKKKTQARLMVESLIKSAKKGSLSHFQQFLELIEADVIGVTWPGSNDTVIVRTLNDFYSEPKKEK